MHKLSSAITRHCRRVPPILLKFVNTKRFILMGGLTIYRSTLVTVVNEEKQKRKGWNIKLSEFK